MHYPRIELGSYAFSGSNDPSNEYWEAYMLTTTPVVRLVQVLKIVLKSLYQYEKDLEGVTGSWGFLRTIGGRGRGGFGQIPTIMVPPTWELILSPIG